MQELTEILRSTAMSSRYDRDGNVVQSQEPFTGKWLLGSFEFEPGTGRRRAVATLNGDTKVVRAVLDASDFPDLIHGEHDPNFNSSRYSDLAFYVSILLEEQILTRDPSNVDVDEIRIRSPR